MEHMEQLAPQSLSTLATAFADADRFDQPLMEAIAGRSLALLPEFQPMQLVHLAWACRKLNYPDLQLFAGQWRVDVMHDVQQFALALLDSFLGLYQCVRSTRLWTRPY